MEYKYDDDGYARGDQRKTSNNNVEEIKEYDWRAAMEEDLLLRRTTRSYLTSTDYDVDNRHILDRLTQESVYEASVLKAQTTNYYDEYESRPLINTSGVVQHESSFDDNYTQRGNLGRVVRWLADGSDVATSFRYDICGNVREVTDPRNQRTTTSYTTGTQYAYPSQVTNPVGHSETFTYDYSNTHKRGFGYQISQTDANGQETEFEYDLMGRLRSTIFPDGGEEHRYYSDLDLSVQHGGDYVFSDRSSSLPLRTRVYRQIDRGLEQVTLSITDGLGRIVLTGTENSAGDNAAIDNQDYIDWVSTEYDDNQRPYRSSNPVSLGSSVEPVSSSFSWTANSYDGLDRVTSIATPDGQSVTMTYENNQKAVTDQVGAKKQVFYDGLGRISLVRMANPANNAVTEANGYDTGYSYDVLDNLTRVRQYTMGDRSTYQERSFVYDSLSRLGSETHPESGTASYRYDANGNLKRRTDARGISTTYSYDSLDRLETTDYTDGTPTTTVTYDQGANGKGRPATASGGSGADAFHYHYDGYDGMGRVLNLRTTLGSRQFDAVYCYNFVGGITQVDYPDTYPSPGFVWEYDYDGQGRQQEMRSTSSGQTETLIDGYRKIYGRSTSTETTLYAINGTQEKITYNNRMQPTRRSVALTATPTTKLMDLRYSFRDPTSSGNNGNVYRMTDRAQSTTDGKQYYSYDYLQRLTEVRLGSRTSSNKIAYGYDRWGNRTSSATKGTVANFMACSTDCAVDATTNRISNWRYDAAGNPIGISSSTLQWDGAGRLESIDNGASASYSYDHLGRRILKRAPSDNTQYFYDVTGKVLWEFDPGTTDDHQKMVRAYFNGRLFTSTGDAAAGSHTVYTDHLGTPRLKLHVTTAASQARDDYYPFGQQVNTVVDAAHDRRFTGKERDAESGLDYFGARYYHSVAGRFLSVDPVLDSADPTNPQSWNRYAYTFNNPLKYVDKTGEIVDLAWDFLSVAWGVKSLIENVSAGNYGWAAVDALGVAVDAVAAAVPIVPGGAGAIIKGARLVNKVDNASDAAQMTSRARAVAPKSLAKNADEMAAELQQQLGKNSVPFSTPGTKGHIDLAGSEHFDKATQKYIPTPHVQTRQINVGPNEKINLGEEVIRPATKQDIRIARELERRRKNL